MATLRAEPSPEDALPGAMATTPVGSAWATTVMTVALNLSTLAMIASVIAVFVVALVQAARRNVALQGQFAGGWRAAWRRRHVRGLARLEDEQALEVAAMRRRLQADAGDKAAVQLCVSMLSGQSWNVPVSAPTTGAELRARVADLVSIPRTEIALVCGAAPLADSDIILTAHAAACSGPPPQLQLLRTRPSNYILSGSADKTLQLWDIDGGVCVATLRGHEARVNCVAVDWSKRCALSGSSDGLLRLWDLGSAACIDVLGEPRDNIRCVEVDWVSRRALAADPTVLRLWDMESARCSAVLRVREGHIQALTADWKVSQAVSGSFDGTLAIWDLEAACCVAEFSGHLACITCLDVDASGNTRRALSGSNDGALRVWNLEVGSCEAAMGGQWGDVRCVSAHWPSMRAFTGTELGALKLWDLAASVCLCTWQGPGSGLFHGITDVAIDWAQLAAFVSSPNGEVKRWDLAAARVRLLHAHVGEACCLRICASQPSSSEPPTASLPCEQQRSAPPLAQPEAEAVPPPQEAPMPPAVAPQPAAPSEPSGSQSQSQVPVPSRSAESPVPPGLASPGNSRSLPAPGERCQKHSREEQDGKAGRSCCMPVSCFSCLWPAQR